MGCDGSGCGYVWDSSIWVLCNGLSLVPTERQGAGSSIDGRNKNHASNHLARQRARQPSRAWQARLFQVGG